MHKYTNARPAMELLDSFGQFVRATTPAPRDHACTDASDWCISAGSSRSGSINSSAWPHTTVRGVGRWWLTLFTSPWVEFMVGPVGAADTRCPSLGRGQIAGPPVALRHLHLLQSNAGRPTSWPVVSDPFRSLRGGALLPVEVCQ